MNVPLHTYITLTEDSIIVQTKIQVFFIVILSIFTNITGVHKKK